MPQLAVWIGGAGTGKTRTLLETMDKAVARIGDPMNVGFVSFTRAARREAAERAADRYDLTPRQLEQDGWFRTLHSVCYRQLGVGKELLSGDAESREWLRDALQTDVHASPAGPNGDELESFERLDGDADKALALWSTARNRLAPLAEVWAEQDAVDDRLPALPDVIETIERYEQAKRLDGRCDFTDMVARFAGWRCDPSGCEPCEPDGEPPGLEAWLHDEAQDTSRLLDAAFRRLCEHHTCRYTYVCGDPFQSIYGWAGADHSILLDYKDRADKVGVMPKSWRCGKDVLALGEDLLAECPDYFDRGIAPADHKDTVERASLSAVIGEVEPIESWLLLARTNYEAQRLARKLDAAGVPWRPTRGGGRWQAPVRHEAIDALLSIETGAPIDGSQWQQVLKYVPAALDGTPLLERGAKARWQDVDRTDAVDWHPWVMPNELPELGATETFVRLARAGAWRQWVDGADDYVAAVERWGEDAVKNPRVRVSTVHAAKGLEADNVLLTTTISAPCYRGAQSEAGFGESQRTKYVAVTRAKRRLVIATDRAQWRWRI